MAAVRNFRFFCYFSRKNHQVAGRRMLTCTILTVQFKEICTKLLFRVA
jgi:hypothetical protein